jgi:ADP-ribose pyrophosphatase YjhB (NUDIX family)
MVTEARLGWAQRLNAISQNGLHFDATPAHDRQRYEQVRAIAAEMLAADGSADPSELGALLAAESGYATPKLDVRGVVFRNEEILLVQERADGDRWTLPGGWADIGESPSEAVVREVREESGYATRAVKLLALLDHRRHRHPQHLWHIWKVFILCDLEGDEQGSVDHESGGAAFFARTELPELSVARVTEQQIARLYEQRGNPGWPADFD